MKTARRSLAKMDLVTAGHSVRLSAFSRNRNQDTWHVETAWPEGESLVRIIWDRLLKLKRNRYLFRLRQGRQKSQKTIIALVRSCVWAYGGETVSIELQRITPQGTH